VIVPSGTYFLAADNRNESDSRIWGPVRQDAIVGKVVKTLPPGVSPYPPVRGGEIVVAIVAGVLLILFVSRPSVKWPTPEDDPRLDKLAQLGLTVSSIGIGGFATGALLNVLRYNPIDPPATGALIVAAVIITAYALVLHHEPFVTPRGFFWQSYLLCALGAALVGFVLADIATGGGRLTWLGNLLFGLVGVLLVTIEVRRRARVDGGIAALRELYRAPEPDATSDQEET
jgi:hypothetical protein